MVDLSKLVSWSLLVILSFVLIAELRHIKDGRGKDNHKMDEILPR